MSERTFYIVTDNNDRLVAIFTNKTDCIEFMDVCHTYTEVVI